MWSEERESRERRWRDERGEEGGVCRDEEDEAGWCCWLVMLLLFETYDT